MSSDEVITSVCGWQIIACDFDVIHGSIRLKALNTDDDTIHNVTANGVAACIFIQEDGTAFNAGIEHNYLEDIITKHDEIKTSGDRWLKKFNLKFNVSLLFSSVLMLNARTGLVDENEIDIA